MPSELLSYRLCGGVLEIGDYTRYTFLSISSSRLKKASEPSTLVTIGGHMKINTERFLLKDCLVAWFFQSISFGDSVKCSVCWNHVQAICCWWLLDKGIWWPKGKMRICWSDQCPWWGHSLCSVAVSYDFFFLMACP